MFFLKTIDELYEEGLAFNDKKGWRHLKSPSGDVVSFRKYFDARREPTTVSPTEMWLFHSVGTKPALTRSNVNPKENKKVLKAILLGIMCGVLCYQLLF